LEKRGEERGEVYKKGGTIPTEKYRYRQYLIPVNTDTEKMTGTNMVYNSTILLPYARPPHGFFWQYLSQKSSYKTGARTQLGVRIRRILLSRAVAYLPRSHQHRHPFGRTGGPTTKAETAARR
jgi:hypothetical protein